MEAVAETPGGKPIQVIRSPYGHFKIKFQNGGELPLELTGEFMRERDAAHAISIYLTRMNESKRTTNGKGRNRTAD